ncbi:MAG TPA: Ig-like domain-containing protein, partial [Candidatus Sulfotelmatobacter sp.]|nr:Ig-like domain-containing protein [Candidatus Sulfotelmatobacter sp.]
ATITAASGSVSGTTSLTVTGASLVSIAVTPANSTMAVGTSKQFTATGTFSDSSVQDISSSVMWSSTNPAAASINSSGVVSSVASGSTTIKAAFGSISGSTGLTVSTAHLVSISISPANPRIASHTSLQLTATGTFSDGSVASNLAGVSWKSSKPSVASVRSTGIVHGKRGGTATITASASGISGTTTLTVGTGTLVSLTVTPSPTTASAGTVQQFTATGTFSDGSTQNITLNSHWSSSVASVATIANGPNAAGQASCVAAGTTVIGANSGGTTGSGTLTVQ